MAGAATKGYFKSVTEVSSLRGTADEKGYATPEGMSIVDNYMFYATINDKGNQKLNVHDLKTGGNFPVYNGNPSKNNTVFTELGHANDIFVNKDYIYIAVGVDGRPQVIRFKWHISNNKFYLDTKKEYYVKNKAGNDWKGVLFSGIGYDEKAGLFILKRGTNIYTAKIDTPNLRFQIKEVYTLNLSNVKYDGKTYNIPELKEKFEREHPGENLKCYAYQSMYYYKYKNKEGGRIYLPISHASTDDANRLHTGMVVVYEFNPKSAAQTLQPLSTTSFRVNMAAKYKNLMEFEGVSSYNNKLYFVANAVKTNAEKHTAFDAYFNDYTLE